MDEYISKQSVIDYLNGYVDSINERGADMPFDRGQRRALINSIQDISVIKGADVQPVKHARWIGEGVLKIYCSNCSKTPDGWPTPMQTDYCPNCGARMDGDIE